jgi:hypothetical protein
LEWGAAAVPKSPSQKRKWGIGNIGDIVKLIEEWEEPQ